MEFRRTEAHVSFYSVFKKDFSYQLNFLWAENDDDLEPNVQGSPTGPTQFHISRSLLYIIVNENTASALGEDVRG